MYMFTKFAASSVLAAVVGSAVIAGCGVSEPFSDEVGRLESAVSVPIPGQVTFTGLTAGATVLKVDAGNGNGFARTSDGKRWGWGLTQYGQAGTTPPFSALTPKVVVPGLSSVDEFKGGIAFFSVGLSSTGQALTIGDNINGQLGNGTTTRRMSPVGVLTGVTAVAAGFSHGLALKSDGTLWAWGLNDTGEVGDGTFTSPRLSPVQVTGLTGVTITSISAGGKRSYALDSTGDVWFWGDRSVLGGGPVSTPTRLTGISSVVAIAAGDSGTLLLKSDATVWFLDTSGTVSAVTGLPLIKSVAAGQDHYLAAGYDGTLWSWGFNTGGQLGDGTTTDRTAPVQVVASSTPGDYLTGVESIAAGVDASFAVLDDGTLWSWGDNNLGRIGR
ncbi:hypothetical protein F0U61_39190 [Archangium violaceum]|uniref:RCC1 domain-containing protein n=1 Tax=Archangium violaceum TaxID=83451 RepID=UPI002B2B5295|nr:hypothetical protein F0U61_39190 [Archangium violaceum]